MPSSQAVPAGSFDYVGFDYLSAKTAATDIVIQTLAGTAYAAFDMTNLGIKTDKIFEYTASAGVDIDGVLIKDNKVILDNNTYYQAENAATTPTDLIKLNASDQVEFGSNVKPFTWSSAADARTNMGVVIGTDVQAYDAGLADIAGLAVTNGNFIVGDGANWVAESGATARASLGLVIGTDVQAQATLLQTLVDMTKPSWDTDAFSYDPSTSPRRSLDTTIATAEQVGEYVVTLVYDMINTLTVLQEV